MLTKAMLDALPGLKAHQTDPAALNRLTSIAYSHVKLWREPEFKSCGELRNYRPPSTWRDQEILEFLVLITKDELARKAAVSQFMMQYQTEAIAAAELSSVGPRIRRKAMVKAMVLDARQTRETLARRHQQAALDQQTARRAISEQMEKKKSGSRLNQSEVRTAQKSLESALAKNREIRDGRGANNASRLGEIVTGHLNGVLNGVTRETLAVLPEKFARGRGQPRKGNDRTLRLDRIMKLAWPQATAHARATLIAILLNEAGLEDHVTVSAIEKRLAKNGRPA